MQAVPHAQMDVPSNISATVVQAAAGIVGANSTGHNQTLPGPAGKRHVVMHHEHGVHHLPHKQMFELEVELVVVLVILHVVVLCFWMWLLYSEKQRKKIRGRQYGAGVDAGPRPGSSGAAAPRRKGAAANWADWRTPKDILASWGKQGDKYKLEKV